MTVAALDLDFFESFKGSDSLLFHGNQAAVRKLAELLEQLTQQEEASLDLHEVPEVNPHEIELTVIRSEEEGGLERQGQRFAWRNNSKTWESFALAVRNLAESSQGHVYLEGSSQTYPVVVSCNEYSAIFNRTDA